MRLDFTLDDGICRRAAIGLVVLATDHTIEHEWRGLLTQDGVRRFTKTCVNSSDITPERLAEMEDRIAPAVALVSVWAERIDVVAFGCTSASMVIGEDKVFAWIRERVRMPQLLRQSPRRWRRFVHWGPTYRALMSPYVRSINDYMRDYIELRGHGVTRMASFEHANDNEVARIDAASLRTGVERLARNVMWMRFSYRARSCAFNVVLLFLAQRIACSRRRSSRTSGS